MRGCAVLRFLAVFVAVLAIATPASAHVAVSSPDAVPGAEAVLTFRVPTESDTASTTKLAVRLPADTPFTTVDVLPMTGWTFTVKTSTLAKPLTTDEGDTVTEAVAEVDWTATAGGIAPGEFGEFTILAGPLPDADSVAFGAVQTYSDGTVAQWNETAAPGSSAEPEHPKPTLTIRAAAPAKPASTTGATVLSIVALVIAALALGVAVVGNARRRLT